MITPKELRQLRNERPAQYRQIPRYRFSMYGGPRATAYVQKVFEQSIREKRNEQWVDKQLRNAPAYAGEASDTAVKSHFMENTENIIFRNGLEPWPGNYGGVPLGGTREYEKWIEKMQNDPRAVNIWGPQSDKGNTYDKSLMRYKQ